MGSGVDHGEWLESVTWSRVPADSRSPAPALRTGIGSGDHRIEEAPPSACPDGDEAPQRAGVALSLREWICPREVTTAPCGM